MIKLHLLDDRKVLATVVSEDLTEAFTELMDVLIEDVDTNYVSEFHDPDELVKKIMKDAAVKAKSNPVTRESIVAFTTGDPAQPQDIYSVVYHEINDSGDLGE